MGQQDNPGDSTDYLILKLSQALRVSFGLRR